MRYRNRAGKKPKGDYPKQGGTLRGKPRGKKKKPVRTRSGKM